MNEERLQNLLTPRELMVYKARKSGVKFRVIGEQYDVTANRVRQIYLKALKKLEEVAK